MSEDAHVCEAVVQSMTCADYSEHFFATHLWDTLCDEMHWAGNGCDSALAFQIMKREAKDEGIVLTDAEDWDYDTAMYESYKNTEKGLS